MLLGLYVRLQLTETPAFKRAIELQERVRDAVHCHFEEADRPSVIRLHYVRDQLIAV